MQRDIQIRAEEKKREHDAKVQEWNRILRQMQIDRANEAEERRK